MTRPYIAASDEEMERLQRLCRGFVADITRLVLEQAKKHPDDINANPTNFIASLYDMVMTAQMHITLETKSFMQIAAASLDTFLNEDKLQR
jgi:predicted FMN-binding regulatory protein PaiB